MTKNSEHQTKNVSLVAQHSLLKMGGAGTYLWSLKKLAEDFGSSFHSQFLLQLCPFQSDTVLLPCFNLSSSRFPKKLSLKNCKI